MISQFDFTTEEWDQIATTPVLVGFAVAKAADSGFFGSLKETKSLVAGIAAEVDGNPARTLIREAAATDTTAKANAFKAAGADALADAAVTACRELVRALSERGDAEVAAGYRAWVHEIARSVAEAAKEHGVRISPAEAALIDRIDAALDLT